MSRLSQMIDFINAKPIPSEHKRKVAYTGISDFEELKAARRELRKNQKEKA